MLGGKSLSFSLNKMGTFEHVGVIKVFGIMHQYHIISNVIFLSSRFVNALSSF